MEPGEDVLDPHEEGSEEDYYGEDGYDMGDDADGNDDNEDDCEYASDEDNRPEVGFSRHFIFIYLLVWRNSNALLLFMGLLLFGESSKQL